MVKSKVSQITNNRNREFSSLSGSASNYEKIINLPKENSSGLTIAEISKLLKVTRNTASVHLAKLEGAKHIMIRKVGMAKIYSLKPEMQTKLTD